MAKILKRPMFRRGGSTNDGIMSGLTDRKQLANGTLDPERARREAKEIQDIMESLAPVRRTRLPLGEVGLALARGIDPLDALDAGYRDFIKRDDARQALLDKRKQAAVSTALGTQLNRRNQSVLAAEKKAKFLLPPNASAEEIRAKTAEIIKSEMTGKTYSETANFRRTLESYRTQYGDGNKAFYHATFDEKIAPTLRQAGESPKGRIKIKDGKYDTRNKAPGVYVDVDNGKIIRITSELEAIEVPELSKLFLQ
jgi:hypothetical protein